MKIALILPSLEGGGAERVNLNLANEFKSIGIEIDFVLSRAKGAFLAEAQANHNVIDLNISSLLQIPIRLARYIDESKPDLLIVSMWGLTALAPFARILSKYKPKVLLVEHSSLINQFKNSKLRTRVFLRVSTFFSYRMADEIAGVSTGVSNDMKKIAILPRNKLVHTLYNPIPIKSKPTEVELLLNRSNWTGNYFKLITVGRLIEAKDHETLIKAVKVLNNKVKAQLIILGEGPLENKLKNLCENNGIINEIVFKGFSKNPTPYYYNADLFILSSIREGFGNVIVEAMGCGTTVVSTNCEHGPSEILNNGEYGVIVDVGDVNMLADAMYYSLYNKTPKEILMKRALDFSPKVSAQRYLQVMGSSNEL